MKPCIILIAGIPASGKTTYGERLAKRLKLPFFSKDTIKERLYDVIQYDTAERENSRKYGSAAYNVCWYVAEAMMKAGSSFLLESNFTPDAAPVLEGLIEKYGYKGLTVLLDGALPVLHKRFCARDIRPERHPGLRSTSGVFEDFAYFQSAMSPIRDFSVGKRIVIDTTDFAAADYAAADQAVDAFLKDAGAFTVQPLTEAFRPQADALIREEWAGPMVVTRGRRTDTSKCPGFVAVDNGEMAGLLTYQIVGDACEVTSLNSLREGVGIGTALLRAVEDAARRAGCKRLWLITTNDNAHAIRFYQRQGFLLKAVHIGALEESRKLKPGIPLMGMDDIPLLHEVEFERML